MIDHPEWIFDFDCHPRPFSCVFLLFPHDRIGVGWVDHHCRWYSMEGQNLDNVIAWKDPDFPKSEQIERRRKEEKIREFQHNIRLLEASLGDVKADLADFLERDGNVTTGS